MSDYHQFTRLFGEEYASAVIEVMIHYRGRNISAPILMKIDTGAARTVIPISILETELALKPFRKRRCTDFNDKESLLNEYSVDIIIQDNTFPNWEIIGSDSKQKYGLLGRDLLAEHFLYYDGKGERYKIELNR